MSRLTRQNAPVGALDVTGRLRGPRYAALGDSITRGNSTNEYTSSAIKYLDADAFHVVAALKLGGRIYSVGNFGCDGQTSTEVRARVGDVMAVKPHFCFLLMGANDPGAAIPASKTKANIAATVRALMAAGITPIMCTCTPRDSAGIGYFPPINQWIKTHAASLGLPFIDFEKVTKDPASGAWISGYSEGTHPYAGTGAGGIVPMSNEVRDVLTPLLPGWYPPLASANNPGTGALGTGNTNTHDSTNMLQGGLFTYDSNADGLGEGWTNSGSATKTTPAIAAGAGLGNWQQLVRTSGTDTLSQVVNVSTGKFAPGDRIAVCGRIETVNTDPATPMLVSFSAKFRDSGAATILDFRPIANLDTDISGGAFYGEYVAPASTASLRIDLIHSAGAGTVRWGQLTALNLSAMKLAG